MRPLVGQRVFARALGYEDLNDHDTLRHDPILAVLAGKLTPRRKDCAPVAGKSTLNRLELSRDEPSRYHKIGHDPAAIEELWVDLFIEAHARAPKQIILDLDATDDPLHGDQEGRFFHAYYGGYCYLPLYVFCGRHLLAAKLRRSNLDAAAGAVAEIARIVAPIRRRWPRVRILLRADSGFCREDRHGLGLPLRPRVRPRPCLPCSGRALTNQIPHSRHRRDHAATGAAVRRRDQNHAAAANAQKNKSTRTHQPTLRQSISDPVRYPG